MVKLGTMVLGVAAMVAGSCAKPNPLVGKWQVSGSQAKDGSACIVTGFEFNPTEYITSLSNGTRVTVPIASYTHDGDNYSITVDLHRGNPGGEQTQPQVLKVNVESGGLYLPNGCVQDNPCCHYVPAK